MTRSVKTPIQKTLANSPKGQTLNGAVKRVP